jgi:hypothetical protein
MSTKYEALSLCNFLHSPITYSRFGPNILLRILYYFNITKYTCSLQISTLHISASFNHLQESFHNKKKHFYFKFYFYILLYFNLIVCY